MSIIHAFDPDSAPILTPAHIQPSVPGFPTRCVMMFNDKMLNIYRENYDCAPEKPIRAGIDLPILRVNYKGEDVAVFMSTIGAPSAVASMEELYSKGCRKFVVYGTCGTLDRSIPASHLIIPTEAYRDEGTSYHYAPGGADYIKCETADELTALFDELELPYVKGRAWTTDAIYRETRGNMQRRRADGCIAVDMECSALHAAGAFIGAKVYQFFHAADSLDAEEWDRGAMGTLPGTAMEQFARIAIEVAVRI
jgi:uridine phosphorylase